MQVSQYIKLSDNTIGKRGLSQITLPSLFETVTICLKHCASPLSTTCMKSSYSFEPYKAVSKGEAEKKNSKANLQYVWIIPRPLVRPHTTPLILTGTGSTQKIRQLAEKSSSIFLKNKLTVSFIEHELTRIYRMRRPYTLHQLFQAICSDTCYQEPEGYSNISEPSVNYESTKWLQKLLKRT